MQNVPEFINHLDRKTKDSFEELKRDFPELWQQMEKLTTTEKYRYYLERGVSMNILAKIALVGKTNGYLYALNRILVEHDLELISFLRVDPKPAQSEVNRLNLSDLGARLVSLGMGSRENKSELLKKLGINESFFPQSDKPLAFAVNIADYFSTRLRVILESKRDTIEAELLPEGIPLLR